MADPDPGAAAEPPSVTPVRSRVMRWVKAGFLVAVVVFGAVFVADQWPELVAALKGLSPRPLLMAVPLAVLGAGLPMLAWRALMADLGSSLSWPDAGRVFYPSQLGKYLPGSVWTLLAQVELGRELRVPRRVSACAGVLALAVSLTVGLAVAAVLLPLGAPAAVRRFWWILPVLPALLAALHPRVIGVFFDLASRLVRRDLLTVRPSYRGTVRAAGWMAVSWLILGAHVWLLVVALGGPAVRSLPTAIGGFALAFCLGVLFVPAPAGAGIRDIALGVALGTVITGAGAVTVALVSRIMIALADFVLAGAFVGMARARRGRVSVVPGGPGR